MADGFRNTKINRKPRLPLIIRPQFLSTSRTLLTRQLWPRIEHCLGARNRDAAIHSSTHMTLRQGQGSRSSSSIELSFRLSASCRSICEME
jgi:hypothetical protein